MFMYLYAIGTIGSQQKIGYSRDPKTRLRKLQTGNPEPLVLHYQFEITEKTARRFEQRVHHEYGHRRLKGEWFSMTPDEIVAMMQYHEIMRETVELSL